MDFGLPTFKISHTGLKIGIILENEENIQRMIKLSETGRPAVLAVSKELMSLGVDVTDTQVKKMIGRWIKEILSKRGWEPFRTSRVPAGNLFGHSATYARTRQ